MRNREQFANSLPHGSIKKIAQMANVTPAAVSKFLKGKIKTSPTIEKAALQCALEYENSVLSLRKKLRKIQTY